MLKKLIFVANMPYNVYQKEDVEILDWMKGQSWYKEASMYVINYINAEGLVEINEVV